MTQERLDRMSETFVATRDALERSMVPVYRLQLERAPRLPRPSYLPPEPAQTVAEYQAALRKLGALGIVRDRSN